MSLDDCVEDFARLDPLKDSLARNVLLCPGYGLVEMHGYLSVAYSDVPLMCRPCYRDEQRDVKREFYKDT